MLDALAPKLGFLSLKIYDEKSFRNVLKQENKKIYVALTLHSLPSKQVSGCVFLGVVLMAIPHALVLLDGKNALFQRHITQYTRN